MTNSLGQLLVAELQSRGIERDDYDYISEAVYNSLSAIDRQITLGESLQFPRGSVFTKLFDPKED